MMLIYLTFKTPDVIEEALKERGYMENPEEIRKDLKNWIKYGEYVCLEYDTKTKQIRVRLA